MENKQIIKTDKQKKDKQKLLQQKQNIQKFREKYYEFYDDIKNPLKGREDW